MTADLRSINRGNPPQPPSGNDEMEARLIKLETRIETILPTLATKGDVSEAKADIIKWLAGIAFASVAVIISVLAFMLNRAVPIQSPAQQVPIIIYPQSNQLVPQSPPVPKRDR